MCMSLYNYKINLGGLVMNVLDNGIDSLQKALQSLNNIDKVNEEKIEFELKDIIIRVHHSIETLVKYLIREKNEYLIYDKLDKVFENKRASKESKKNTIQFLDAINRICILYEIKISDNDYDKIKDLNEIRNSITHYEINLDIFQIQHLISNILKIMIPVFSNTIRDFKENLKKIGLNEDIELMYKNDEFLVIKELFHHIIDLDKCLNKVELIKEDDINEKYKLRDENIKNNKIIYSTCDICSKDFFVETVRVFKGSEMFDSLGYCEFCGFNKSKEYIFLKDFIKNTNSYTNDKTKNPIGIIYIFIEKFNFYSNRDEESRDKERFDELKKDIYREKENLKKIFVRYLYYQLSFLDEITEKVVKYNSEDTTALTVKFANVFTVVKIYNDIIYYIKGYSEIFNEIILKNNRSFEAILKSNDLYFLFKDKEKQIEKIIERISIFIEEKLEKAKKVETHINDLYGEGNLCYYDLLEKELFNGMNYRNILDELKNRYSSWEFNGKIKKIKILRDYFVQRILNNDEEVNVIALECEIETERYCTEGHLSSKSERFYIETKISNIKGLHPEIKVGCILS